MTQSIDILDIRVSASVILLDSTFSGCKIAAKFKRRRREGEEKVLLSAIQYLVGGILHSLLYIFVFSLA